MMFKRCFFFISCLSLLLNADAIAQSGSTYRLWYDKPASEWTEALPVGNGRLGAMIYGGVEKEHIQFNEETLWTGRPREHNRQGASAYLDEIRKLLFEGKQQEAEKLAEAHFMGLKSEAGDLDKWIAEVRSLKGMKGNPALPDFDDSSWKTIKVPTYEGWETVGFEGLDGALWFRTTFNVPASWAGKNLVLDLNRIRNQDFTYVNGVLVGNTNDNSGRKYIISKDLIKKGKNTLSVQVLNYYDKGGIAGYKDTTRRISVYPEGETAASGIPLPDHWKYFIQDDNPPAPALYQDAYQPFGDLFLDFKNHQKAKGYKRELDLNTAVSKTSYTVNGVTYTREYFASQPNQAIVVRLTASKPGSLSFEASLESAHKQSSVRKLNDNTLAMSVQVRNGVLKGESRLRVEAKKGKVIFQDNKIVIDKADEVTFYLTAGTNYVNYKDVSGNPASACEKALTSLKGKSFEQVKRNHIAEYQQYYRTFSIQLGKDDANDQLPTDERIKRFASSHDPAFAALYLQYGRYLLISSSRPGTRPANLQGIWNNLLSPPWGSKYTMNINAEMNYWPAELLNLSPMHQSFFNMVKDLAEQGKETAETYYKARGWVVHHNTDIWRATAPINASNHGIWVTGGAWAVQHLWEHYLFTQDKEFLRNEAYPIMKSAAQFFVDFLIEDPKTGWLISTPSNSPENGGLVAGPAMDHQIIRGLFKGCIEAAAILGVDKAFADTLQEKYKKIAPNQIGKYGQLQEWLQDIDDPENKHRHVSHLWGLHPGSEINYDDTPELVKAAKQSLIFRGDAGTGWSLAWKINFWARFKDGDHALKMIKMLIHPAGDNSGGSYPNLFDAHPPFQIDGNFGGAAGIGEMLVQSHTAFIDILPALPKDISEGSVKGIRARGGFELGFDWKNGKLNSLTVRSEAGNPCVLRYNGKVVNLPTEKGKIYRFNGDLKRL